MYFRSFRMRKTKNKLQKSVDLIEVFGTKPFISDDYRLSRRLDSFHGDVCFYYGQVGNKFVDGEYGVQMEAYRSSGGEGEFNDMKNGNCD